jgi:hypothetical protein
MSSNTPYEFHDYPWLDCVGVSDDGREISLLIKYWACGEFCCNSPACRFSHAFFWTKWSELRELLRREGVEPVGPIKFMVRVVYEAGAKFAIAPGHQDSEYTELTESSWSEYETDESRPDRAQEIVRSSD